MNHSDIQSRMASYLDGELALGDRALFDGHLDNCESCSRELREMRSTINLLRRLPTPEPPADLVDQVMHRIAEGEGQPDWLGRLGDTLAIIFAPRITIPVTALVAGLAITFVSGDLQLRSLDFRQLPHTETVAAIVPGVAGSTEAALGQTLARTIKVEVRVDSQAVQAPRQTNASSYASRSSADVGKRAQGGSGAFLYRVANEPLGPLRRQARERNFFSASPSRVGPYLGASAVSHQDLLVGGYPVQWGQGADPFRVSRVASSRTGSTTSGNDSASRSDRRREELDYRLRYLLQDPPGFAKGIAEVSLAERELWLRELAVRANETGDFERVELALSSSGDPAAEELAREFVHSLNKLRATWAEAEVQPAP